MTETLNAWSIPLDTEDLKTISVPTNSTVNIVRVTESETELDSDSSNNKDEFEKLESKPLENTLEDYSGKKVIVLDSGAIISSNKFPGYLLNENIEFVTTQNVIQEIKSSKAKNVLNSLPFPIKLKTVWIESLKSVKEFAESTGDYSFLSNVDMEILALAYQLEKATNGDKFIKKLPEKLNFGKVFFKAQITPYPTLNKEKKTNSDETLNLDNLNLGDDSWGHFEEDDDEGWISKDNIQQHKVTDSGLQSEWVQTKKSVEKKSKIEVIDNLDLNLNESNQAEEYNQTNRTILDSFEEHNSNIGCITTDFAMQNVLIHMGLNLISVDGYRIKTIRRYVLRCTACSVIVPDTSRVFCPNCGNHSTLKKVECVIDEEGKATFYYNPNYKFNLKGVRYQIPKPKGGRNIDPILREDDMISVKRGIKRNKIKGSQNNNASDDLFSREYVTDGIFDFSKKKNNITDLKDQLVLGKPKPPPKKFKKKSRN